MVMWYSGLVPFTVVTFTSSRYLANGYDASRRIESARLYGNVGEFQYFFVDLLIGAPRPQRASVIVDTGSTVCAFPCSGCEHCGPHLDPAYDVTRSQTFNWIPCRGDEECDRCEQDHCGYLQSYTEGSSISGGWFRDYVALGDEFQQNPAVLGRLGCHLRETKLFYTQRANGIFGMAPGHSGKPTILEDLFRDQEHISTSIFALCFSSEGGLLTVGGHNDTLHEPRGGPLTWVPMKIRSYYEVEVQEMTVAGVSVRGGFGHTIVDSGTTYTYLPHNLYLQLRKAVSAYCDMHESCGGQLQHSRCWDLSGNGGVAALGKFPTIEVRFGADLSVPWRPEAYLYRQAGTKSTWCYGFDDNGAAPETVLGATFMLHKDVVFDLVERRLGLSEARCPVFEKRPDAPSGTMVLPSHPSSVASGDGAGGRAEDRGGDPGQGGGGPGTMQGIPLKPSDARVGFATIQAGPALAAAAALFALAFAGFTFVGKNLRAFRAQSRGVVSLEEGGAAASLSLPARVVTGPPPRAALRETPSSASSAPKRRPSPDVVGHLGALASPSPSLRGSAGARQGTAPDRPPASSFGDGLGPSAAAAAAQPERIAVAPPGAVAKAVPLETWLRPGGGGSGSAEGTPGSGSDSENTSGDERGDGSRLLLC